MIKLFTFQQVQDLPSMHPLGHTFPHYAETCCCKLKISPLNSHPTVIATVQRVSMYPFLVFCCKLMSPLSQQYKVECNQSRQRIYFFSHYSHNLYGIIYANTSMFKVYFFQNYGCRLAILFFLSFFLSFYLSFCSLKYCFDVIQTTASEAVYNFFINGVDSRNVDTCDTFVCNPTCACGPNQHSRLTLIDSKKN